MEAAAAGRGEVVALAGARVRQKLYLRAVGAAGEPSAGRPWRDAAMVG